MQERKRIVIISWIYPNEWNNSLMVSIDGLNFSMRDPANKNYFCNDLGGKIKENYTYFLIKRLGE